MSMGAGKDAEGVEWVNKAEKKKKSFQFFSNSRYEEAAEMYERAGKCFQLSKNWGEAGRAFCGASECWLKLGKDNDHEAAEKYVQAGACFKKAKSAPDAVECYMKAIGFYTNMGRYQQCAKHHKEIAEILEDEHHYEEAIEHYDNAAQFYETENTITHANSCKIKIADMAARIDKFDRAIETYKEVAQNSEGPTRFQIKKYLFRASLCHLCLQDLIGATRALEEFKDMDPQFSGSRECGLIENLIEAVENTDSEKFATDCHEYDQIMKLDAWETSILVKVKNSMAAGAGGNDPDEFC